MDDDFPEQPPARMSFVTAILWSGLALFLLLFLSEGVRNLRPDQGLDLVGEVLCQAAAFLLTLYVLMRIRESERPLGDVLALRPTPISLCILGAIAGAVLQLPCSRVEQLIEQRWPRPDSELTALAEAFTAPTIGHKIALVAAAALIGPLVEELFFRGAIFRGVRRGHDLGATIVGTAALFAVAHLDARNFPEIFAIGVLLTYARAASGSLWPGFAMHAGFNGAAMVAMLAAGPMDPAAPDPPVPLAYWAGGTAVAALAMLLFALRARKCETCALARAADRS